MRVLFASMNLMLSKSQKRSFVMTLTSRIWQCVGGPFTKDRHVACDALDPSRYQTDSSSKLTNENPKP